MGIFEVISGIFNLIKICDLEVWIHFFVVSRLFKVVVLQSGFFQLILEMDSQELYEQMVKNDEVFFQDQGMLVGLSSESEDHLIFEWLLADSGYQDEEEIFFRQLFYEAFLSARRTGKIFRPRRFENTVLYPREFKQRFQVPMSVLNLLERKLSPVLTRSSLRNHPLSARHQILIFLYFLGTNSFYHVLRECVGIVQSTVCKTVHR